MKIREQCNICGGEHLTDDHPNIFTDPEAHELAMVIQELQQANRELADAINVVQDRVDAVITQHRVLAERVARLERVVATIVDYHQEGEIASLPEPPDASWRD